MTKIQNGCHFDVCTPKWPISKRRLVRRTGKISVKFRENISNFKDCIALTSSSVRISSLANLSKLATRGHNPKHSPGPFTMLVQYEVDIPNSLEVISKCNRNGGGGLSVVKHKYAMLLALESSVMSPGFGEKDRGAGGTEDEYQYSSQVPSPSPGSSDHGAAQQLRLPELLSLLTGTWYMYIVRSLLPITRSQQDYST